MPSSLPGQDKVTFPVPLKQNNEKISHFLSNLPSFCLAPLRARARPMTKVVSMFDSFFTSMVDNILTKYMLKTKGHRYSMPIDDFRTKHRVNLQNRYPLCLAIEMMSMDRKNFHQIFSLAFWLFAKFRDFIKSI